MRSCSLSEGGCLAAGTLHDPVMELAHVRTPDTGPYLSVAVPIYFLDKTFHLHHALFVLLLSRLLLFCCISFGVSSVLRSRGLASEDILHVGA